jgi:hypothetical protein
MNKIKIPHIITPTNEQKAKVLIKSRDALLRRLLEAKSLLTSEYRKAFKRYSYDYNNRRLVSECGKFRLQWKLRPMSNKPIGPDNQQTSVGIVTFEHVNLHEKTA